MLTQELDDLNLAYKSGKTEDMKEADGAKDKDKEGKAKDN